MTYKKIDNTRKINICFLGCGNITGKHARTLKKFKDKVLLGFASRRIDKSTEYNQKYKGKKAYGSYLEAINDDWPDVIMINLPPVYHFEWAEKALTQNKHIILEKPPLLKSTDFDSLTSIAHPKGLQILVAENYYYKPVRTKVKELIHSGLIGEPKFIHISAVKYQKVDDWRNDDSLVAHGALYEGGIHWISFISGLGYEIESVKGFLPPQKNKLERSIQAIFETLDGPIVNLIYSWEINSLLKGLRFSTIHGTEGSIRWESNGVMVLLRGKKKRIYFPGLADIDGKGAMFSDFINALYSGAEALYSTDRAKGDLKMVEDIYRSIH